MKWLGYVVYAIYVILTLWLLIYAIAQLHLMHHARVRRKRAAQRRPSVLPFVSVQVPVYNERYVIEGLLESLAALDYPKHLYEIQVLDDSTDETSELIDRQAVLLTERGVNITVVRRDTRTGYKAGALQHGLALCKGDLVAIFDADFRPPPSFLMLLVPYFNDEKVGLVQARWGHINRGENFLTRIQTYLLDMHFMVEQEGRYQAGYFINFCGTAGIWRRKCITEAGGWDGSVLSEDLDLSYRAQLKGWKILYDKDVEVPALLPAQVPAFRIQQFRWTKGIAQIAKKVLRPLWKKPLPFGKKLHGSFHLLGSVSFVCLFINAILTVPLLMLRNHYPEFVQLTNYTAIGALNLAALAFLYYKSSTEHIGKGTNFLIHYPLFLLVYLAMSVQNSIAVIQGLVGVHSPFVRTPKDPSGAMGGHSYVKRTVNWISLLEAGLLAYFLYAIGLSFYLRDYFLLFFFVLMSGGLSILVYHSFMPQKQLAA